MDQLSRKSTNLFEQFTNQYSLSKTLRFELKPIGKTLENIIKNGILSNDEHRAESYKEVKKIIDAYHKEFIENSLFKYFNNSENILSFNKILREYHKLFTINNKSESEKKDFAKKQGELRKLIVKAFETKRLFGQELIKEDLEKFIDSDNYESGNKTTDKNVVREFEKFTTYFNGFYKNRENMYSDEEKSIAISYRLINDNLPKYIGNIKVFNEIKETDVAEQFTTLMNELKNDLGGIESIESSFTLDFYGCVLTQKQIDIYNLILSGKTLKDGKKIKGLNEYINLHNQQHKDKSNRLPKLTILFKQILSDRRGASWLPEKFEDDNSLLETIETLWRELKENLLKDNGTDENSIRVLLSNLPNFDLFKIYLRGNTGLTDVSKNYFGNYSVITNAILTRLRKDNPQKTDKKGKITEKQEEYEERIGKEYKRFDSFSIHFLNECLALAGESKTIENYFKSFNPSQDNQNLFEKIEATYNLVRELLNTQYPESRKLVQSKDDVAKLKEFLDALKDLQFFIKPLLGKGDEADKDADFYAKFSSLWGTLDKLAKVYDMVRNYVTQKPYSIEKIKLNFENSTLLNGWDKNKERDNASVILRKKGLYYLAIMNKQNNQVFEVNETSGECYEKMEYKLLPGANKMLPKVFFSAKGLERFNPSEKLLEGYIAGRHKKGDNFDKVFLHELIDFFKKSINIHDDWKNFNFNFSDTENYDDISGFYREVEQQGYRITFKEFSESYINQQVVENKIYLFQIYNKDFSEYSKGMPNLHTLYWKELFDPENLRDVVYKLNGEAEIFYRKRSLDYKGEVWEKGHHYEKLKDKFKYPIISNRRYALDKFQFHVPITTNFKAEGNSNINFKVNRSIHSGKIKHIIGIDRGERHLLYLSLIDLDGKIIKQFSLNEIINEYKGNSYKTDYHKLLDGREVERQQARESWKTIETIKELKQGYLSQVIHKITQLMIEYQAIVVLEDLNSGFKNSRQKFEKNVYQQFEKMLIDKLNFLVDKKKTATENGGLLRAYQLTSKFESFKKIRKQNGFLFYISAWNTSKIDPVTGFVNMFDTRYTNVENAREFFNKFDDIGFDSNKNYFEFKVNKYSNFNIKAEDTRQNWVICTNDKRIETFRNTGKNNQWDNRVVILTDEFRELFEGNKINYNVNLKKQVLSVDKKEFFERLLYLFKLTLQMRNSITGTDIDYLISPVRNESGEFFDSRLGKQGLPDNADANGAYNIARKGLWAVRRIDETTPEELERVNLAITNKEWLQFVQKE